MRAPGLPVPSIRLAIIVGTTLFLLRQVSGISSVIYHAPTMLRHAGRCSCATGSGWCRGCRIGRTQP